MIKKTWKLIKSFFKTFPKKVAQWLQTEEKLNDEPRPRPQTEADKALLMTSRNEVDGLLEVFEGTIPDDLHGVFYVVYPVGSVNSNGLPFPGQVNGKYNKEYGSPIMNGDGMMISVSFNGTQSPAIKSRLMKTPCYFADYNSRQGTGQNMPFGFSNFGITRMSLFLGERNELNTAAIPVKFGNSNPFLLSTYDVGRPFITDPLSMKLQTPVGQNTDWVPGTPPIVPWAFQMIQTTAHPSFDPNTEEVFTVNYSMSSKGKAYVSNPGTVFHLQNNPGVFKDKLTSLCREMADETDSNKVKDRLQDFFDNLDHYITGSEAKSAGSTPQKETNVWLMRWKGQQQIEKWSLTDQSGNALQISECMHQTALTRDFIVLTDCAFKFSLDLLVNNPFPEEPFIDSFIRKHLAGTMHPFTDCYIVKRAALSAGGGSATAFKLQAPIPVETIHYSCDYENTDGKITLYGIHNTAACVAEWIRTYDESQLTGEAISNEMISLFALGSMDLNRIGKWVIDVNSLQIDNGNSKQYYDKGKTDQSDIGPNTWTLGLYTFRDIISATKTVAQIKYLWYVANGLDSRMLTSFIYSLYQDYENRIVPVAEILSLTKQDLPQTLVRLSCETMTPVEHYQFDKNTFIRSLHFIPRPTPSTGAAYETDGHIFCTVQAGMPQAEPLKYRSEYWVFDAAKISAGPVCKFKFDDIQFCFTLHSAWLESALPFNLSYDVDVRQDYDAVIGKLIDKPIIESYFKNYVYPDWYAQKNKQ
ncbi:MAG: carotenoid oxygenase family protein [Ferruginibacter sp.]